MAASADWLPASAVAAPAAAYEAHRVFAMDAGLQRSLLLFIKHDCLPQVVRANHSLAVALLKEVRWSFWGHTKQLGAGRSCSPSPDRVNTILLGDKRIIKP